MIEWAEIGRKIEAQERVARIRDAMAAAGTMEEKARRRHMNALDRAAQPVHYKLTPAALTRTPTATTSRVDAPLSPADAAIRAQGRATLAAFGIPVVKAGSDG